MLIDIIAGARPNFMKIAPILEAIEKDKHNGVELSVRLIHTGQHYDKMMSDSFFEQLGIPKPHFNLEVGSGTQAEQTARVMMRYEELLLRIPSHLCLVVGDVNSTMACSIVAKKLNIKVAHVEAGIRSGDMFMPEEINRIVTDAISDYFFTTTKEAGENLKKTGVAEEKIFFVGNTMIDTLLKQMKSFRKPAEWDSLKLKSQEYFVVTLHRPSNVDDICQLNTLLHELVYHSRGLPLVFPVHPRTAQKIEQANVMAINLYTLAPMGYLEFNYLVKHAKAVITDSGGVTEETTVMGVPCMTLRDTTERPETCLIGTNELLGNHATALALAFEKLFQGRWKKGAIPALWDGKTADRIVKHLKALTVL